VKRLALALLVVAASALAGCGADAYLALTDWTLQLPDGKTSTVEFPLRLDAVLPDRPTTYVLETDVPLPETLRGRPLTLSWRTKSMAELSVGGEEIQPLSLMPFDTVWPSQQLLVFRIPRDKTDRPVLHLALVVRHVDVWTRDARRPPRLAAAPYGETQLRVVSVANYGLFASCAAIFVLLALAAGISFSLDRRRTADGWYAVLAFSVMAWHLTGLGLLQPVEPRSLVRFLTLVNTLICVSIVRFIGAYFRLTPPRLAPGLILALGVVQLFLCWGPFQPSKDVGGNALIGVIDLARDGIALVYAFAVLLPLAGRRERMLEVVSLLVAFNFLAASALFVGLGLSYPLDLQPMPVAWLVLVITQGVLLLRLHASEMRGLNTMLKERVVLLEARSREVGLLNEELRRQIHDRSARLADAIARIGRLTVKKIEAPAVGAVIGERYRILSRLGKGGMGAVYEVERNTDKGRFALKTLLQADSGAWLARLAREAQAATAIAHPNVVGIVDVDVDASGIPFLVMELVKGEPLSAKKASFGDAEFARAVVRQIAAGLSALHQAGIVHRDLKPENVLLEQLPGGAFQAKIADFGIARVSPQEEPPEGGGVLDTGGLKAFVEGQTLGDSTHGSLTHTGFVFGTPLYMAPELAGGVKDASPSCDLWSLGILAYQVARGEVPFVEPPVLATGVWKLPALDVHEIAEPLRSVVRGCLDIDPSRRPTASEVAVLLR
jgi:hypothetical protein